MKASEFKLPQVTGAGFQGNLPYKNPSDTATAVSQLPDDLIAEFEAIGISREDIQFVRGLPDMLRHLYQMERPNSKAKVIKPSMLSPDGQQKLREFVQSQKAAAPPQMESPQSTVIDDWTPPDVETVTPQQSAQPQEDAQPARIDAGLAPDPKICPRCGWDTNNQEVPKFTENEYQQFIISTFSQSGRFYKEYKIGDNFTIRLRTLLHSEIRRIHSELSLMLANAVDVMTDGLYLAWSIRMRMAMSLAQLRVGDKIILENPTFEEWHEKQGIEDDLALKIYTEKVENMLPPSESAQRIIGKCYRRFAELVSTMEAKLDDVNFT